jgi:hypothetical protein
MKKIFVFLLIIAGIIPLHADGRQERDRQAYGQIQLKVVNLTENSIKFHFNTLYKPREIKSQEEFVTMNTPVNKEHPGFIGIERNNNGNAIIYRFSYHISELRFLHNLQYFLLVMDNSVQFIEGNIDEQINYFDESLYESRWKDYDWQNDELKAFYWENGYPVANWYKVRLGLHFIDLFIVNNTGSRIGVRINTILENENAPQDEYRKTLIMNNRMTEKYTIDYELYMLGGIVLNIYDSGWRIDHIDFSILSFLNHETLSAIELKINSNGHEVIYKEVVSFEELQRRRKIY